MNTYKVTITEINKCVVEIEADSIEEARKKVEAEYWNNPNLYCFDGYEITFK